MLLRTESIVEDFKSPAIFKTTIHARPATLKVFFYERNLPFEDFLTTAMVKNLLSL